MSRPVPVPGSLLEANRYPPQENRALLHLSSKKHEGAFKNNPNADATVVDAPFQLISLRINKELNVKSQSMSTNLRVCVVGGSRMGADHIARLTGRIVGAEVAVVADVDVSRAKKAIEAIPPAVAVCSISQALDQADVNGVLVATPGFLHEEVLLEVGERDLPILCEKPLTPEEAGPWTCGQAR
jgi:Oxidoreductase family, NAD-binding Rossmann fold